MRKRLLAALLIATVLVGAAIAGRAATSGAAAPKATGLTEISGGNPTEQALLRDIVAGMQPTVVEKIEITGGGHDVALHFTAPHDRWNLSYWQETLIAAAFRDRANAVDDLTVSIFGGDANGVLLNNHGPATPLPPAKPGDAEAARQKFENAAAKTGVSLKELTIYHPDGIAVAATLESDDPALFLVHRMRPFLDALGDRSHLDGTYISLVDASGQTVWESSYNERIWEGSVGSRPDLEGCSPVSNWGNPPPPCR